MRPAGPWTEQRPGAPLLLFFGICLSSVPQRLRWMAVVSDLPLPFPGPPWNEFHRGSGLPLANHRHYQNLNRTHRLVSSCIEPHSPLSWDESVN